MSIAVWCCAYLPGRSLAGMTQSTARLRLAPRVSGTMVIVYIFKLN